MIRISCRGWLFGAATGRSSLCRTAERTLGELISVAVSHCFDLTPPGAHAPRITIDDLVVCRERWTFAATEPDFADTTNESTRYLRGQGVGERAMDCRGMLFDAETTGEREADTTRT